MFGFQKSRFKTHLLWIALVGVLFVPATFLPANLVQSTSSGSAETPEHFARRFADFEYCFHAEVQDPRVFLATKSGDCDDFATLAACDLARSGYATRLFAVRMARETHVVCYVPSAGGYLDYNNRAQANPWVPTDGSLTDIATKVAGSFGRDWVSAYEFCFFSKRKWLVNSVVFNRRNDKTILAVATPHQAAGNRTR